MEQQIRFCTSADGTRIAYATYGNPAARTLVYVQAFETTQEGLWTGAMRSARFFREAQLQSDITSRYLLCR